VLLDANPLDNISHTRKINAVVLGGTFYPLALVRSQSPRDAAERGGADRLPGARGRR
jgi:hypothetical protein